MDHFVETPLWEMAAIRSEMLNYFLGARVKVSLMLREKRQLEDGRFVLFGPSENGGEQPEIELPYSAVVPGTIRYANHGEISRLETFPVAEKFKVSPEQQQVTQKFCIFSNKSLYISVYFNNAFFQHNLLF